jgi:hypothetical protein
MAQRLAPFVVAAVSLLLAAPALAAPDELSSRLAIVSGAGLRSAPEPEQARAVSLLPHGPGSLLRDPAGDLIVNVRVSGDARERVPGVRDAGASMVAVAPGYHLISASAGEGELRAIARAPGVESVTEELTPMTGRVASPAMRTLNTCAPGVVSEGDQQLGADVARDQYRVDGAGIKVGVMSDSFNTGTPVTKAADDIATADLPGPGNPCGRTTPVQVLDDSATQAPPHGPTADEGRAMTQIVHDLAPGADLAFATAFTGQVAFAANIKALANAGADVIADDIIYFAEPYYQDGIVANAVNDVTTNQGVAYFSMAFNNNRIIAGNDSNSWEAPAYRNAGSCPALVGGTDCMDFDPGPGVDNAFNITWSGSGKFRIGLQWAEPQNGVATNLDLYLIDAATNTVVAFSTQNNVTSGLPSEFVALTPSNTTAGNYRLVIRRVAGFAPRLKWINNDNGAGSIGALEYPTSSGGDVVGPTIYGHNGTAGAQTVGAVPYFDSSTVESYSGRGPVTHLFGPVNGVTPAPPLASAEVLDKPDVVATDGGINSFFGSGNRFFGTSAAAPHAAAVGALQLAAEPSLSAAEVKAMQKSTAVPVGSFGSLAAGAGLIDAPAALIAGDRTQPPLRFVKKPKKRTKKKRARFVFATEPDASLECILDSKRLRPCSIHSTFEVKPGRHRIIVQATDRAGNLTAAHYSWKVKTKKRR